MNNDIKSFWEQDNFRNIKPTSEEFPEGFDPREVLKELIENIDYETIVDFGCGYGRLCEAFPPEKYVGIDISDRAIEEGGRRNPDYLFASYGKPLADIYLAYTVFLHLSDEQLMEELETIQTTYFIIAEILGSEWSDYGRGKPPAYNRDDYSIMEEFGYVLVREIRKPYKRYVGRDMAKNKNTDISFLLWRKAK